MTNAVWPLPVAGQLQAAQLAALSIKSSLSMSRANNCRKGKYIWTQKADYLAKTYIDFSTEDMVPLLLQNCSPAFLVASPHRVIPSSLAQ